MTNDGPTSALKRDYGFIAIVALVIVNAIWLLLMPAVPVIARATMNWFHLKTSSFGVWAIQQTIPSMYNFANRYEVREFPSGLVAPIAEANEKRYINHFPVRVVTFAQGRAVHLVKGEDRWFILDSTYRGQTIETRIHAKPTGSGGFVMIRQTPNRAASHE